MHWRIPSKNIRLLVLYKESYTFEGSEQSLMSFYFWKASNTQKLEVQKSTQESLEVHLLKPKRDGGLSSI